MFFARSFHPNSHFPSLCSKNPRTYVRTDTFHFFNRQAYLTPTQPQECVVVLPPLRLQKFDLIAWFALVLPIFDAHIFRRRADLKLIPKAIESELRSLSIAFELRARSSL